MPSNVKIGASFEKYFKRCIEVNGWWPERIPDGAKQIGDHKIIRVKAPFDFFATKTGKAFFCDCKTTIGETFPFSAINQDQVAKLLRIEKNGFVAGFIIHFRQVDKYCFISAKMLSEVVSGGSIKARASIDLGKEIDIDRLFGISN